MHASEKRKDGWTPEEDAKLQEMRSNGLRWIVIAKALGRTFDACVGRYDRITPKELRRRTHNTGMRWSPEEEARLRELMKEGHKPREIAVILGRPVRSVHNKIQWMRDPRLAAVHAELEQRVWAPPHLFEERDRRQREERSLTQEFFGDPPFQQSALAKKMGVYA